LGDKCSLWRPLLNGAATTALLIVTRLLPVSPGPSDAQIVILNFSEFDSRVSIFSTSPQYYWISPHW